MKDKFTMITIFTLLFGMIFPTAQTVVPQTPAKVEAAKNDIKSAPAAAKFALLVGINDYTDKSINDLNGCENDVRLMREVLADVYGFKPNVDTKELVSSNKNAAEQPTQKGILDNFDKYLIANAKKYFTDNKLTSPDKGATVVFYYSGHGSHLPDGADKDESDGEDETIVPMDSDAKGIRDIRDDEFDKRFSELKKYTSNITFIFDSCHSGTITRGVGTRSIERPSSAAKSRGDGTDTSLNESMDSSGESYVTISGSLPNEKSQEDLLPDQNEMRLKKTNPKMEMNGFMTYYLAQTLREMPGATYRDVMKRVNTAVQKRNSDQHPQVEGDVDRPIFGAAVSGGRRTIDILTVKKEDKTNILTIDAGKIVGAYPGGAVAIYKNAGDAERFAVGEIIEPTGDFKATVKVLDTDIPDNARVVLVTPFFGSNKRLVALDLTPRKSDAAKDDVGLQMINRLNKKLEKNDFVTPKISANPLGDIKKDWNVAIVRSTYGDFKRGNLQAAAKDTSAVPQDLDEVYYLASTNGNPLYNFYVRADDPQADNKIQEALEKFVRVDNLRTLGNESSVISTGLEFRIIKLKSLNNPPKSMSDIVEDGILKDSFLSAGDLFSFEITNKTGNPLFAYLYSIETDGSVKLLYEPKTDGDIMER